MPKIDIYIKMTLLFVMLSLSFCTPKDTKPDFIIYNAEVYSVDKDDNTYEALAVKNGIIMALGTSENILKSKDNTTVLLDLGGAFAIPGLIEGHGHFSGLGQSLMNLNFLKSKSWEEIVAMVEEKVKNTEKGEWIIGRGWHQEKWKQQPDDHIHGYPRHFDLSTISPDHPVMLIHASGHGLIANENAMKLSGVTTETPDPSGGEIVRDDSGNAIGVFEERAASIIYKAYSYYLEDQSDEQKLNEWYEGIALAQATCLANGITSFQDAGAQMNELKRYKKMADNEELNIRLWSMIRHPAEDLKGNLNQYRMIDVGNKHFTCRAIKTEVDGALGSFGAWLLSSYDDKEDFVGQNTTTIDEVKAIAKLADASKMQLCVHAIGDRANREVLDLMMPYLNDGSDKRWRIEHAQHIDPEDIPRFGKMGVIAAMQAIHCTSDAPFVEKRLGNYRAKSGAYNWRALIDSGAIVTNGTDTPVEDVNPLESFYASVTRKRIDNGFEFFPENSMTREEAIYSYTMANAFAAFEENDKGSLEVGKLADITVLSKNLVTCTDDEILNTEVLYTIVGGEIKYQLGK